MGMTKRHLDNTGNGSSKWLPAVSNEKKMRGQNAQASATHTIQIGKGEIQITNQAQSPGPSSIKMYQQQAPNQQQQSHLRVTNQVGANSNGMYMSNQAEANRASIQNSNNTQRN